MSWKGNNYCSKSLTLVVSALNQAGASKFLDFLLNITKMKTLPRTGWISHGVSLHDVESVADHTFSSCAISMLLTDLERKRGVRVNIVRVLRMAILHDLSESLTFDISKAYLDYLGRRGEAIKAELERAAWNHLIRAIKHSDIVREYTNLQDEFLARKTIESKIVHAADGLDILLQVINYNRRGYPPTILRDLWKSTTRNLRGSNIPSVRKLHAMIVKENKILDQSMVK